MALNVRKLAQIYDFNLNTGSIGTIRCGTITVGNFGKIEEALKADDINGPNFARTVLCQVGHHINEGEDEIEGAPLTDADVNVLSDEEIEIFAREFVVHNGWLLESPENAESSKSKNETGKKFVSALPSPVDSPKENGESDSDFLVRVLRHYVTKQTEQLNQLTKSILIPFSKKIFSDATENLLKRQFVLSDQLKDSLRSFDLGQTGTTVATPVTPPSPELDLSQIPKNPVHETNRRLSDVLRQAEELCPVIIQSAELFRNLNDTVVRMHTDFSKSAQKSLRTSLVLIGIAVTSLVGNVGYLWWNDKQSSVREALYQQNLLDQQMRFESLFEQQDERYRQLLSNQETKIESLIRRQDRQVEQTIQSLLVANKNQSENDRRHFVEALSEALQLIQGEPQKMSE